MRHPRFVAADDTFPQWQLPSGVREVYVELEGEPLLLLEGASLSVTALEKAENRLVAWRTFESSERNYTMPIPPDCGVLGIADVNISRCVHTYGGACDVECRKGFVGEVSAQCDSDGTVGRWNSSGECVAVGPCFVMGSNKKGHLGLSRGDKRRGDKQAPGGRDLQRVRRAARGRAADHRRCAGRQAQRGGGRGPGLRHGGELARAIGAQVRHRQS